MDGRSVASASAQPSRCLRLPGAHRRSLRPHRQGRMARFSCLGSDFDASPPSDGMEKTVQAAVAHRRARARIYARPAREISAETCCASWRQRAPARPRPVLRRALERIEACTVSEQEVGVGSCCRAGIREATRRNAPGRGVPAPLKKSGRLRGLLLRSSAWSGRFGVETAAAPRSSTDAATNPYGGRSRAPSSYIGIAPWRRPDRARCRQGNVYRGQRDTLS